MTVALGQLADEEGLALQLDMQVLFGARRAQEMLAELNIGGLTEDRFENQRILAVARLGKPEADVYANDIHAGRPAFIESPLLARRYEAVKIHSEHTHFEPGGHGQGRPVTRLMVSFADTSLERAAMAMILAKFVMNWFWSRVKERT